MNYNYWDGFFAVLILVFTFWKTSFSEVVIIISAAFILIKCISNWVANGYSFCVTPMEVEHKTGEEIFLEKNPKSDLPSKKEVGEVLGEKKSSKKKVAKKKTSGKKTKKKK